MSTLLDFTPIKKVKSPYSYDRDRLVRDIDDARKKWKAKFVKGSTRKYRGTRIEVRHHVGGTDVLLVFYKDRQDRTQIDFSMNGKGSWSPQEFLNLNRVVEEATDLLEQDFLVTRLKSLPTTPTWTCSVCDHIGD